MHRKTRPLVRLFSRWTPILCVAALAATPFARAQANTAANGLETPNLSERYLVSAADHERASLGLPPLRWDTALAFAARAHAMRMLAHNAISHQFEGEPDLAARASAAGARFSLVSENVAVSPTAIRTHEAWMNSEGHRHNLLDPNVDAVGIAVVADGARLFAVEDFERSVPLLPLREQETAVAQVISAAGVYVDHPDLQARRTCSGPTKLFPAGPPSFVMRYTTADLTRIPDELHKQLATAKYNRAVVAACSTDTGQFSMYSIAVLLYR